jgi:hypothetical protein
MNQDPIFIALLVLSLILLLLWMTTSFKKKRLKKECEARDRERSQELSRLQLELNAAKEKLAPIVSVEDEVLSLKRSATALDSQIASLRKSYQDKREYFDKLLNEVAIYDEKLSFAELGVYEPHFEFSDSESFKKSIEHVRQKQKALVASGKATYCPANWTVDGSQSKGKVMMNRQTRLTMRAFNNECETALSNVRWNNASAMEKRIHAAAAAMNRENESMKLTITDEYVKLKTEELRLTHEYREFQKAEKEERAELARAEREERKLLAEAEAAEKEEAKFKKLLEKAQSEAAAAIGGMSEQMRQRIEELEKALAEAHDASERARAMAEMTKTGYVYIISNIGSFGEDVVKIGLTRRLDPEDRIRELGDASVPFGFDIHAMIYSDDAPSLESALHREFAERRINITNFRKEFFRVGLEEVENAVGRLAPTASFFKDREAQEWHETLARRKQVLKDMQTPAASFPISI